jgi:OmpA-OmpF porin, OOP family
MRLFFILNFLLFSIFSFSQTKKIRFDYNNGHLQGKGKIFTCPNYDKRYPMKDSTYRRVGRWKYYYQNGNIKSISNYKKISDCISGEVAEGIWQDFDEQGRLINQKVFKNGTLWSADISTFYLNDKIAGQIQVRNGITDTLTYIETDSANLIKNGDFNFYFGPPKLEIMSGQNQLEKQVPFWFSPDKNTPDYYNQCRRLKGVPDNENHEPNEKSSYVGIILYHQPSGHYSEYITGELNSRLKANQKYCLRIKIRLSQNAGFFIDRLGACFSDTISHNLSAPGKAKEFPGILFNESLDNRDEWKFLCDLYVASGFEKYITVGRFSSLSETVIKDIDPLNSSEGDYNKSAYYLVEKIELLTDTAECNCHKPTPENAFKNRLNFSLLDSDKSPDFDMTFILGRIFFDFDKSVLLPASYNELERLLSFLKIHDLRIKISGHTDNKGSDEHNMALSLSRAKAVSDWLVNNGIGVGRIQIEGCGSKIPIVKNDSEINCAINRRVEFKIIH